LSPFGLFLGLLIACAASLLFLCPLLLEVAMTVSTLLVFFGMPLAIVLWPVAPSVPGGSSEWCRPTRCSCPRRSARRPRPRFSDSPRR
jgi:hypothetical protein